MSRRAAALLIAVCAVVLVAAYWLWRRPATPTPGAPAESPPLEAESVPVESFTARLHRPAAGGGLEVEEQALSSAPDPRARVAAALGALLAAPAAGAPGALFPTPVAVRKILLAADGTLYVDLRPEAGGDPPPAGSTEEMQRVYALVHTALDAAPEALGVVLLWNGVQRRSLSGHVDTGHRLARWTALEAP